MATPRLEIIVGFDGSPSACSALEAARNLASGGRGHLRVLYISQPAALSGVAPPAASAAAEQNEDAIFEELRGVAGSILDDTGTDWTFEHRQGDVARDLLAVADETLAAEPELAHTRVLLVVGSTDKHHDQLFGSVPRALTHQHRIALVTVPARVD